MLVVPQKTRKEQGIESFGPELGGCFHDIQETGVEKTSPRAYLCISAEALPNLACR